MADRVTDTLALLRREGIAFETAEHPPVFTIDEMLALSLPHAEAIAKNLFVRDDKRRQYYLFVLREEKQARMKEIRARIGSRPLTFASEQDLMDLFGLTPGSVTPLGALADTAHRVAVYVDEDFRGHLIGVHPNRNTATVFMQADDLVAFLLGQGVPVQYLPF